MNIPFTIKKRFLLLLAFCAVNFLAEAQNVGLLKDINTVTTNNASNPEFFASTGTLMCFAATTDLGKELWVSDGTSGGTVLLKDINPGTSSSNIANLFAYNGIIYFSATDGVNGIELWRTDGTPQGTYLFKDINAGSGNSSPAGFTVVNGILFFSAANATNGQELWKTDGTVGGTVMVKDIRVGAGGAEIGGLTAFNNKLVFTASASDFDSDPYISDGTAGGTFKLANINQSGDTYPGGYYNAGGLLYFSAHNYSNSYEPWVTDGTQAGTRMLKNINLQSAPFVTDADSYPGYFTLFNGNVYFSADDGLSGRELYQTDGTNAGTVLLKDINLTADGSGTEGSDPKNFIVYNNTLYFTATDGTNYGLWKTNGTAGGTVLVKALIYLENLFIFNNTLYFTQYDAVNGTELWKSDGTTNGTVLVKDMNPGTADSNPQNYFVFNGNFYFAAVDAVGKNELWMSDGTNVGTTFIKDINLISGNSNPGLFTTVGSESFFIANDGTNGAELWKTNGTNAGTTLVKDIRSGSSGTTVSGTVALNNTWVAALSNGSSGLWKSDGTGGGTSLLKSLNFYSGKLTLFNNQAYFNASSGANAYELWKTDGTVDGTSLVIDISPSDRSSAPQNLTVSNNALFFTASGGTNGYEQLYKTDGTAGGTVMVKDFGYGDPTDFVDLNGILLFQLYSSQLWKSDGTEIGTELVKEIYPSGFAYPSHLTKSGNYVFLSANDGVNGTELWRTDGTNAGTVLVKNINTTSATASSSPDNLLNINGTLYFVATDGVNGRELWKSDGTANGTVMVKNCNGTSTDSNVENLINFNGTLYFTATNTAGAKRLWKTDGTLIGTTEVNGPSEVVEMLPSNLSVFGSKLIFSGLDAEAGVEPFIFDPSGIPNASITDQPDNLTICSTGPASFTVAANNASTYQWQVKIGIGAFTDLTETGVYSGVNTPTLNISNVSGLNGYQYRCVVSNGFINTNSNAATLVAITPSAPTSVAANNANLCSGNPVSLSATCSIGTVHWYNQASGGTLIGTGSPLSQSPIVNTTYYAACKNGSCEGSRAATNMVNVATSPTSATGVTVSSTSICNGSSVTLTATCATGTVKWYSQATGGISVASSSPRVLSPTSDITYYVACNDGTCESTRTFVGNITVNVQPTAPSSVSFSQTSICEGTSITMTTSCATGTITWYNQASGGSIIGTGSPFTHSPSVTTRYYATCKTNYCESSVYSSSQINVSPVPLATGVSVNTTTVCSGQQVTLTGTCSNGTLRWYTQESGGSYILTGSPVNHSPTVNTTYYASCRVGACERERIATDAVTVTTSPGNPSSVSVNNTTICLGESVSLTATCLSGTVTWYNQATGGSAVGTGSPLSQSPAASGRYYASCKNGVCESNRGQTSQITVTSVPAPTGVSVNPASICSGESVTLTGTCSSGTIRWYTQATGGTFVVSGSPASQSPTINTTYYASCIIGSCESSRVATSPVTLASPPANPMGVSVNNTNICSGESVSLVASCVNGTITWYNQETGGSAIGTGSPLSQNVAASTTFYASCKTTCNESSRIATNQVLVSRTNGGLAAPLGSFSSVVQNNIFFYKTTISQGITVDSMAVIISSSFTGGARVKFGIYSDNSGVPNTLLASSSGNSNTSLPTLPIGTSKFPLVSNVYLNAGTYWIGFVLSSGEQVLYNASGANAGYYKAQTFSNALPATMTGLSANANQEFNVYFSGNVDCAIPGQPTSVSAIPASVCEGDPVTLSATCTTGVATWYAQNIGGTAKGTGSPWIITPIIDGPVPTRIFEYYVSCKNGANESNRVYAGQVSVYAVSTPSASTGKSIFCKGESISLSAGCMYGTVRWYNQATGGSIIGTTSDITIPNGSQSSTTYYITCNNAICESIRVPLVVHVGTNTRKYVKHDAVGGNDGSSWQNAFTSLQSALDSSCAGAEIWIAKGTYHPSYLPIDSTDNRYKVFLSDRELFIYGGFSGNETLLSQRNIAANPTVLSGDFNNDDVISGEGSTLTITNNAENAFHVLAIGGPNAGGVIDGLTIKGGNASGPVNSVNSYSGGLIYYAGPSLPEGQYSLRLNNVTFIGNSSTDLGGSMLISGGGTQIKNSRFIKNQSGKGGGIIIAGPVNLSDVIFEGNRALNEGGGVFAAYSANVTINRAYFKNNYAANLGGAYSHETGIGKIDNSVFTGNSASFGGGLFITSTTNFDITNSTIAKNSATNGGGLVYSNSSTVNLKNTIIWGNTASVSTNNTGYFVHPTASYPVGTPRLNQTNSLIQGFGSANGNIDANPLFRNENDADGADNKLFTIDDGFNLTQCSPAINAGTNTGIQSTDILSNTRPYNSGTADIGAFEYSDMPLPTALTASVTDICTPTTITLTGSCEVGTVTWYNQDTGGSVIGTGSPINQLVSANVRFYVTCKDNCAESDREPGPVVYYGTFSSPAVFESNPSVCINKSITLSAACPGGTVSWYNANTTTLLYTGQMFSTPNLSTNTTYKVRCEGTPCSSDFVTVNVTIAANPTAQISGSDNLTCTTASVTRTASGGASYQWSGGLGTNAVATINSPGTYTVTVTNASGCTATATTSVTNDGSLPTINISGSDNLTCTTTSVTRTASGGGTYLWSNGLGTNATATITSPGTYTVTVTGTNGCTATATTSVTRNITPPLASINGSDNLTCTTTSVTRTASGGGTYLWSNGLGTNATATISSPGTYTVTVTGTNGCTATATTSVTRNNTPPSASISGSDNLTCGTTSVTRTASGGGTYLWSNSLGTNATATISSPGTYTVTITGVNGCTATATTAVTNDGSLPTINISGSDNLTCTTTSVTRTASGGGNYLWSNSLGTNATATISSPGTYTVTVTGTNGCTATATTTVTRNNTPPSASISGSENLTCGTASVTRTASGGGTYLWSNGLGTNATATISSPGTYTVTVTGVNGCTATATTAVTNDGSLPTINISGSDNLTCTTTSVTRTASGGGTYLWSNSLGTNATATISSPGTYTVTVTGTNGCTATATTSVTRNNTPPAASISGSENLTCGTTSVTRTASGGGSYLWSNGLGTNATATISSPGTYTVTVTGTNGCTATATTTVTRNNTTPSANISGSDNLTCTTTSVTRTASGGGTYLWSNSLGTNATATISSPGTYTVTVTGANGCTATATTTISIDSSVPDSPTIVAPNPKVVCTPGTLILTASGCAGTVNWSNGGSGTSITLSSVGTYSISATCKVGSCTSVSSAAVTGLEITNQPSTPTINAPNPKVVCAPSTLTLTASGCAGTVNWSNGTSGSSLTLSSVGTYSISATCSIGSCTSVSSSAVTGLEIASPPVANASNTGPYNIGQSIQLNASGGSSYSWSGPNNFTSNISNPNIANALTANAGIYTVTVSNGGCSATATTQVIVNGLDPCIQVVDLIYVKSGNPYQPMFSLKDGMVIQQSSEQVSIMAVPICQSTPIGSVDLTIVGPDLNWAILQNVEPFTIFDNLGSQFNGRNLQPGTYTFTVVGYPEDNRTGGIVYGPVVTTFTIVGNSATISAPTLNNNSICSGSNMNVSFSTTGSFAIGNEFQIQLSDINGSFVNPTIIGISNSAGNVNCQIPQNIAGGTGYLIRIVSTNQVITGSPTNVALTIMPSIKNFTMDINSGTITEQASQKITATNKIIAPANVNYRAGKAVELNPGFFANTGTVFKAEIGGCNN